MTSRLIELETVLIGLVSVMYLAYLFSLSRRRRPEPLPSFDDLFFIFVVPCLNEELVIRASLERLLAIPYDRLAVLVIDDGSDDRTAEVVADFDPQRVWLLRRYPPDARRGKGAALNAAYRHLLASGLLDGRRPDRVIVSILDADGRIDIGAPFDVAHFFGDPQVASVQIGVRMSNASHSLLARMQDAEFVIVTDIYQRARLRLGSVGLGGNGQFNRLSALISLGDSPWSDCLTEDFDLGIRLLANGWTNAFLPTADVHQQAVVSLRRLVNQRSRWFQGYLQCWRLLGTILRSRLSVRAMIDIYYQLTAPFLVLIMTVPFVSCLVITATLAANGRAGKVFLAHDGAPLLTWYLLAFGLTPIYGFAYWLKNPELSFLKCWGYAHLYAVYSYMWMAAGWLALWRITTGRRGWIKTERTAERHSLPDAQPRRRPVPVWRSRSSRDLPWLTLERAVSTRDANS